MNNSCDLSVYVGGNVYEFVYVGNFIAYGDKRYLHIPSFGYFELAGPEKPSKAVWMKIMNQLISEGIYCAVCDCIAYTKEYIDFFVIHSKKFIRMFYTENGDKVDFTNVVFIEN